MSVFSRNSKYQFQIALCLGFAFLAVPRAGVCQENRQPGEVSAATARGSMRVGDRAPAASNRRFRTYANPIDLPYRYQLNGTPGREAADPTVVEFKGHYWLFASHSKGYWWSDNLLHWRFVEATGYDVDKYAPTAMEMNGKLYLTTSENPKMIWVTGDPMTGQWHGAATLESSYGDPDLFKDDDGRVYMYYGLSPNSTLHVDELNPETFKPIAKADIPESRDTADRGWEVPGDENEKVSGSTWIEGSWLTKRSGRYYLEYSAPGTEYKTYANGVLVSSKPMGPFVYQPYSPFAYKPTGFICGAGHGSTFLGPNGNWWHIGTMTISRRFNFERRLGLFPTYFTQRGEMITDTYLGDYPHYIDGDRKLTGWMLLSRKKAVTSSSTLPGFPAGNAADEDVRTWWSARTGNPGEWFQMDLGGMKTIEALQINFADQDSKPPDAISHDTFRYVVKFSDDGVTWRNVIDKSELGRDAPHDYEVLPRPERARYIRIVNVHSPDESKFSLYDLRIFGNGRGPLPQSVSSGSAQRDSLDPRRATISWRPATGADFYIVRLGIRPDLLTLNYQVYDGQTSVSVRSLNVGERYFYAIDTINERGIEYGKVLGSIQ